MIRLLPPTLRDAFDRLPTTDLYLLNPLAELKRRGARLPAIRNIAPNAYLIGRTGVIVRYGRAEDMDRLRYAGAARLVYLADDDFSAGADDPNLPERYRARLAAFAAGDWPTLKEAADIVVVPGAVLAALYGAKACIVAPAWHRQPAVLDHFDRLRTIEIVHLGTGSHRADLAPLAPLLARLLDAHPRARLTLFSGDAAPETLARHPHVRVRRPMPWWRYRRALGRMRFHLALYPLADTAFNRARSANKLYEHALVGAASLMSAIPALREASGPDLGEIFVDGGEREWTDRIASLLAAPAALRRQAEAAGRHIRESDPLGSSAHAWENILAPDLKRRASR